MKTTKMLTILVLALGLMVCLAQLCEAEPMGTAFTYQGRLIDANSAAEGEYDFQFKLYDDANTVTGNQVGSTIDVNEVTVNDGYFTVELDFGSVFNSNARWLEIGVRPGDSSGSFTTLSPRQEITPAPYALHASSSKVKQLIADFVVASGESVTAGDVVRFLEGGGGIQKGFGEYGEEYVFNQEYTRYISAAALSSTKFVVAYQDYRTDCGTAVIGNVSGDSITYGSEYVFNQERTEYISVAALSSDKFVVAYRDYTVGTAIIGDVSGSSITYGYRYSFSGATSYISVAALSSTKFVVAYRDEGSSSYGTAIIGDVPGSSTIIYGSESVFNQSYTSDISVAALSSTEFVVAYRDVGNSSYGTARTGDVLGNSITYGSEFVFNQDYTRDISTAALSSTKFVVAYSDGYPSIGTTVIGNASGGYSSEYVFNQASTEYISVAALSSDKFVVAYRDSIGGTTVIGDASGKIITYGEEYVFNSARTGFISVAALSPTKPVVAYQDYGNFEYGTACIGTTGNIVGIAKESATDGQTVPVIIDGVSDVHSGLIPGEVYYTDISGDLTTDVSDNKLGLAISATEILLDIERYAR